MKFSQGSLFTCWVQKPPLKSSNKQTQLFTYLDSTAYTSQKPPATSQLLTSKKLKQTDPTAFGTVPIRFLLEKFHANGESGMPSRCFSRFSFLFSQKKFLSSFHSNLRY